MKPKALNFTPGTAWSYSNTGYNLAAIIVSRVSGQPFAEFSRERLFRQMRPVAKDAFAVPTLGTITFRRAADGRVSELSVKLERVWDLRFQRLP